MRGASDGAVELRQGQEFSITTDTSVVGDERRVSTSYTGLPGDVKPGDQIWLNFVNSSFHEAMVGLNSKRYRAYFKQWFGEDLPLPPVGYPLEFA